MRRLQTFWRAQRGSAAAEMALIFPLMLAIMFGSVELGNFFLDEHALTKQVRDGARYASRLPLAVDFDCDSDVFDGDDDDVKDDIIKATKDGAIDGDGNPRWTEYWTRTCASGDPTLSVAIRCVAKSDINTAATGGTTGIYTSLPGDDIPVVTVSGSVKYRSVLSVLGIDAADLCLRAESDVALAGA